MLRSAFRRSFAVLNALPNANAAARPSALKSVDINKNSVDWKRTHVATVLSKEMVSAQERWRQRSQLDLSIIKKYKIADPYRGRSVRVKRQDFNGAVKQLDRILARNNVRRTLRLTERHEKKGVKRRRLRSEQWRKHFAAEVRKNVQLVAKIRRRGA